MFILLKPDLNLIGANTTCNTRVTGQSGPWNHKKYENPENFPKISVFCVFLIIQTWINMFTLVKAGNWTIDTNYKGAHTYHRSYWVNINPKSSQKSKIIVVLPVTVHVRKLCSLQWATCTVVKCRNVHFTKYSIFNSEFIHYSNTRWLSGD